MLDSQKRKHPVSKENFFPVPLGRNRREIAQSWFQDLAGNKPLSVLAKKVIGRARSKYTHNMLLHLVVCLTLLASFFLLISLKHVYMYIFIRQGLFIQSCTMYVLFTTKWFHMYMYIHADTYTVYVKKNFPYRWK